MPLGVFPEDKPTIYGLGVGCVLQNYLFFMAYETLWSAMPISDGVCEKLFFIMGWETLTCWIESVAALGVAFGAYIDSFPVFWLSFGTAGRLHRIAGATKKSVGTRQHAFRFTFLRL